MKEIGGKGVQSHQERFNLIAQLFLYSRNLEAAPALLTHPGINRQDLYPYSDRINQIGAQHVMVGPAVLIARVIPTLRIGLDRRKSGKKPILHFHMAIKYKYGTIITIKTIVRRES